MVGRTGANTAGNAHHTQVLVNTLPLNSLSSLIIRYSQHSLPRNHAQSL